VSIIHQWGCALDSGESVRALFIDFTKAFDRVDHTLLLNKLLALGAPFFLVEWMYSFLKGRRQRVKIHDHYSTWTESSAGMPQGTWLGPLSFIALINDLKVSCPAHKFVDDVTLTEILPSISMPSAMKYFLSELSLWASANFMQINAKKTKEIILGPVPPTTLDPVVLDGNIIEGVPSFKLLGVHIDNDLRWNTHIDFIATRVNSRLYTLKQLKRSGLPVKDLLTFYTTVIRPVLEYANVVWHHSITVAQSDRLEALQKRAMRIISSPVWDMPYPFALLFLDLESLHQRRINQGKKFFSSICKTDSCLNHLLPPKRSIEIISRLRHARTYPTPYTRTQCYCSFIIMH
jgi:hypothetical protein